MQVFFPLRIQYSRLTHWIVVVMNVKKTKFQVLDSLWNLDMYKEKILQMVRYSLCILFEKILSNMSAHMSHFFILIQRSGIERMTDFARITSPNLPGNVGNWKITFIQKLPRQTDGCVYGLLLKHAL